MKIPGNSKRKRDTYKQDILGRCFHVATQEHPHVRGFVVGDLNLDLGLVQELLVSRAVLIDPYVVGVEKGGPWRESCV